MTDEFDNAVTASLNQTATNARMGADGHCTAL
jgi:hypothetical protein